MKVLKGVSYLLVVVGAVNWGLVGLAELDLVNSLLGSGAVARLVYVLVGLAGLVVAFDYFMAGMEDTQTTSAGGTLGGIQDSTDRAETVETADQESETE